jgi:MFS family permease
METAGVGLAPRERRALTVGLVLAVTMYAFEALAVAAALPRVLDDLGGIRLYGAAFSAYMLGSLVAMAVSGEAADRRGPEVPFAVGLACFAGGLVVAAAAPSMVVVVVARALQGAGGGAVAACAYVAVGRGFPEHDRARVFALLAAAWVVPGLIAPGAAGAVAEHIGWRWVFAGLLPMPFVVAALALPAMRHLPPEPGITRDPSRLQAALLLAAGTAVLLFGMSSASIVAGVPLVAAGGWVTVRAARRILPVGVLRAAAGLPAIVASRSLLNFAFFGADSFIPLALTDVRGQSTVIAGIVLTTASVSWAAASWVQSRWGAAWGPRRSMRTGLVLVGLAAVLLLPVLADGTPVGLAATVWLLAGAGMGLAFNASSVAALSLATPGTEGRVSAALQVADALGVAIGTGTGGAIIGYASTVDGSPRVALGAVWVLMAVVSALGVVAARRVPGRT